jgi:HAMP domain-containing protein
MPREIMMDELLRKQRAMSDKAQALTNEKDVDRIQTITAELERDGRELEELARAFEKQELAKAGPPPKGKLEVVLTPGQRDRVHKLTGVDLPSVVVADEMGVLSKAMPSTDPRDIELLAINEARKLAASRDADGKMRAELQRAIADIEQSGFGEVKTELEKLKADPNWMGGLLHKK